MSNTAPLSVALERLPGNDDLDLPTYMTAQAAGMDIYAAVVENTTIAAGDIALIPTGFKMGLPAGYEAQIRPRSGLALKHGITLPNSPGTIDADYRGEVGVIVANMGKQDFVVERGMRIAQMVIAPVTQITWQVVDSLDNTERGEGGFGSTKV